MVSIRIESIVDPLAEDPRAAHAALRLLARGAVMGFVPADADTRRLDGALVDRVLAGMADQGVGVALRARGRPLGETLELALEQTEHSPMPDGEWPSLLDVLGEDTLALLLSTSTSSVRRYAAGTRATPQDIADRLHVLALVVADLAGAYNEFGIRRWFMRPRPQLDGRSPWEWLGGGWDPDGEPAAQVRELAAALAGAGAT
jgi:hypothetical protein